MKLMSIYKSIHESGDVDIDFGDWKMDRTRYQDVIRQWTRYYGSPETAEDEFWGYQYDVKSLWDDGGTIYRVIFLKDVSEYDPDIQSFGWSVDSQAIDHIASGFWLGADRPSGSKPFLITAETPPHNTTNKYVDIKGNPDEKEFNVIDDGKLKIISIEKYK